MSLCSHLLLEEGFKLYSTTMRSLRRFAPQDDMNLKSLYASLITSHVTDLSLIELNCGDEKYLDYIKNYTLEKLTPADILIRNWNGIWNKDMSKMLKFLTK